MLVALIGGVEPLSARQTASGRSHFCLNAEHALMENARVIEL
jgi:hypothetical protein